MAQGAKGRKRWWPTPASPREQLLLAAPLFLFYHLGLLLGSRGLNGADFFTRIFAAIFHWSAWPYLAMMAALTTAYVVWLRRLREPPEKIKKKFLLLLLESLGYALLMGPVAALILRQLHLLGIDLQGFGLFERLVASAGAGFYEELVFRLGGVAGLRIIFRRTEKGSARATILAVAVSAPLFALAHHLGPGAEAFAPAAFLFRTFLGVFLSLIFLWRGFAPAAWSHFLYDVFVLCLLPTF